MDSRIFINRCCWSPARPCCKLVVVAVVGARRTWLLRTSVVHAPEIDAAAGVKSKALRQARRTQQQMPVSPLIRLVVGSAGPGASAGASPGLDSLVGQSLVNTSRLSGWSFNSQKVTAWVPGSMEFVDPCGSVHSDGSELRFRLVTVNCHPVANNRLSQCRCVEHSSSSPVAATAEGAGLTLRNVDMVAEYVLASD